MIFRKLNYAKQLNKNQWKTKKEIRKKQFKATKAILKYAYYNTRFYREKFRAANITPNDIKSITDFRKVPLLEKEEVILNYPTNIVSEGYINKKCDCRSTSGSTGKPIETRFDKRCRDFYDALYMRSMIGTGYRPWNSLAFFHWKSLNKSWYERLGLMNKNTILMSTKPNIQIQQLSKIKPDYIYCFTSLFNILFDQIRLNKPITISPKAIILTGENTSPKLKKQVSSYFNCSVFEQYATTEFEIMAWECKEHSLMHINEDSIYMEITNGDEVLGPEEEGDIVVTGLANNAMPLIRYKIGDSGSISRDLCNCGRGLSLLKSLQGRVDDFITLPSGRRISPTALSAHIETGDEFFRYISQYKVIQEKKNKVIVKIIRRDNTTIDEAFISLLIKRLNMFFGEKVNIYIKEVSKLPLSVRGKLKVVESKVRQ